MINKKNECLVSIRNLRKSRGPNYKLLLRELDIHIGDKIVLLGGSGSGKSTSLDLLALVLKPDDAEEFFWRPDAGAVDVFSAWSNNKTECLNDLRRADLGYVLQTGGLLPFLSVRDNILLPANLKKIPLKEQRLRLDELYQALNIGHLDHKFPTEISVGERQRCAIARAVIHRPALILADEPTASLDPPTADRVFELLLSLSSTAALVVATHDVGRAQRHGLNIFKINCPPVPKHDLPLEVELVPGNNP